MLKAARAYENLCNIYYFQGDKGRLLYSTLRGTNLAEAFSTLVPGIGGQLREPWHNLWGYPAAETSRALS